MKYKDQGFPNEITEAIEIQFIKPIFEEDFVEAGMQAWLVKIEREPDGSVYTLYFNFSDFEVVNDKYFIECFYKTDQETGKKSLVTAMEAGYYEPRYSVYFCTSDGAANPDTFSEDLSQYIKRVL